MPEHRALRSESPSRRSVEFLEDPERGALVRLVVEGDHTGPTGTVGPDAPREEDDPSEPGTLEFAGRSGEGERPTGETERHGYPPPYGGCTANSSPGRMRDVRPRRYRPFRTNREMRSVGASAG